MYKFVLGTVASLSVLVGASAAENPKAPAAQALDGAWTVVSYEKDGQRQADATEMTVKADAGTITFSGRDGKPALTLKVAFGPNGAIQVTEGTGSTSASTDAPAQARAGVYVLTQDYLAVSVNNDTVRSGAAVNQGTDGSNAKSRCSIVLKREGTRPASDK